MNITTISRRDYLKTVTAMLAAGNLKAKDILRIDYHKDMGKCRAYLFNQVKLKVVPNVKLENLHKHNYIEESLGIADNISLMRVYWPKGVPEEFSVVKNNFRLNYWDGFVTKTPQVFYVLTGILREPKRFEYYLQWYEKAYKNYQNYSVVLKIKADMKDIIKSHVKPSDSNRWSNIKMLGSCPEFSCHLTFAELYRDNSFKMSGYENII